MFWQKRLHQDDPNGSWAVPYADLVTLLLAVFVMIAGLSDLRGKGQPPRVRTASVAAPSPREIPVPEATARPAADSFDALRSVRGDQALAGCRVRVLPERITVSLPAELAFSGDEAVLLPAGRRAIERLAECLHGGRNEIEIRGYADPRMQVGKPVRDAHDQSYARAKAVGAVLSAGGVRTERIRMTACGRPSAPRAVSVVPSSPPPDVQDRPVGACRVEIVVHAAPLAGADAGVAEEG